MAMMVVGFRLGNDETGQQLTAVVTQSGYFHKNHGVYGRAGRYRCHYDPQRLPLEHPVQRSVAKLRELHGTQLRKGRSRSLIPPASVRVDVDEPDSTREDVINAFVGAAPNEPKSLEDAVRAFYQAIGAPIPPLRQDRVARAWQVAQSRNSRAAQLLRTLTHGVPVTYSRGSAGFTVSVDAVRIRVGGAEGDLDRAGVTELHAALNAWLRLNAGKGESMC
ncbi:hypothetical protein [Streptomyces sp. NRRL S-337]|uniref:hypothetical protein n=1 Tax=Streptomyces sp. NRRL S-337 TaxID=1463900 RepID=UPI0004C9EF81|nr:hypothetical protein [Streptomyces sp. NRRL S-337]